LLRGRQGGWLSPNDCRLELGSPRVPGGDGIEPPVAGGRPAGDAPPSDSAPPSDACKIARLDDHRGGRRPI
jgi:hypothetical protein